jgi:hypothetical protein
MKICSSSLVIHCFSRSTPLEGGKGKLRRAAAIMGRHKKDDADFLVLKFLHIEEIGEGSGWLIPAQCHSILIL